MCGVLGVEQSVLGLTEQRSCGGRVMNRAIAPQKRDDGRGKWSGSGHVGLLSRGRDECDTGSTAPWGSRRSLVAARFPRPATGLLFEHVFDTRQG